MGHVASTSVPLTGLRVFLCRMMANLAGADPSVAKHLRQHKIDPHYFAFRWITVLFCQDLETFPEILRVWDYMLSDEEGCKSAVLRFCTALVVVRSLSDCAYELL